MQCLPFVCFAHHVDQITIPSVVSVLLDHCIQASSYRSLEYGWSLA